MRAPSTMVKVLMTAWSKLGPVYPDLDFSKTFIDDPVPMIFVCSDTVSEESNDSAHTEEQVPKDDGMVIA